VHDPLNECKVGNRVVIQNTRPISARKSFKLLQTLSEDRTERIMEAFEHEQEVTIEAATPESTEAKA
jgi:dihydroneopterin aldolase